MSTDTDGDHLIENTNVGHGWVEGGKLYGAHTTLYLAAQWAGAMREAFVIASYLQQDSLARIYMEESRKVSSIINTEFWNEDAGFYYDGKLKDGSFEKEPTVQAATFLLQKLAEPDKAAKVLLEYASNAFSSDWGVRIIKESSPMYNPEGYHYGSVWPLFTGWTALAEYAYFRPVQGYMHIMNNLLIHKNFAKGLVEEVMNGEKYEPSGVCSHQCWSETMVLQPVIEGMLGYQTIAEFGQMQFTPSFPPDWDTVYIQNLKVGPDKVTFYMKRSQGKYKFTFESEAKTPISIRFAPRMFPGSEVVKYTINRVDQKGLAVRKENGVMPAAIVDLNTWSTVEIQTKGGISVIPVVPDPEIGSISKSFRIIEDLYVDSAYVIEVEGLPGKSYTLSFVNNNGNPQKIENARLLSQKGEILTLNVDFEPSTGKYARKLIKINFKSN